LELNESLIISGCGDHKLRLWGAKSGECLRILNAHLDGIYSLQFEEATCTIATGSIDKTVALWKFMEH